MDCTWGQHNLACQHMVRLRLIANASVQGFQEDTMANTYWGNICGALPLRVGWWLTGYLGREQWLVLCKYLDYAKGRPCPSQGSSTFQWARRSHMMTQHCQVIASSNKTMSKIWLISYFQLAAGDTIDWILLGKEIGMVYQTLSQWGWVQVTRARWSVKHCLIVHLWLPRTGIEDGWAGKAGRSTMPEESLAWATCLVGIELAINCGEGLVVLLLTTSRYIDGGLGHGGHGVWLSQCRLSWVLALDLR